jgi:arginine decarboxylase
MVEFSAQAYNAWRQTRLDVWSRLEEVSGRLSAAAVRGAEVGEIAEQAARLLDGLASIERFWAFPGPAGYHRVRDLLASARYGQFARSVTAINTALVSESYRTPGGWAAAPTDAGFDDEEREAPAVAGEQRPGRPYFEVLVVETLTPQQERALREEVRSWRRPEDEFSYELVVVGSGEEAVLAARLNTDLQACVIRRRFAHASRRDLSSLEQFADRAVPAELADHSPDERAQILAAHIARLRPEMDLYLMTEIAVEEMAGRLSHHFRRVFHAREGLLELHLSILAGVGARYRAPFFEALRAYSRRPTGVFHALPISQGKSILNSHWIKDMVDFYGLDIFLAETSATGGGLDSLLEPTGPLRQAQQLAADTFGSRQTYFVTNGTSTANKIVAQSLLAPGDIALVDRNCHQSHHYGLMLSGANVSYLEAYPLNGFSIYGAVPLREIKSRLLALRAAGKLDRVKLIMLTNCTFDGIVYDVARVMEECLAIKPDLAFLWDEAWFAFARFHPVYRDRTGMQAARDLVDRIRSGRLRERFERQGDLDQMSDQALLDARLVPDPARTRVRVYSTQSTHKTLTSLRQGSMIHVYDQDFSHKVHESFHEAYMAHTSTSPNYQILASLDVGRRQAALEGYELVQKQVEFAMRLRDAIDNHPLLSRYMHCLTTAELIPSQFRPSGIDQPLRSGLSKMIAAWQQDEFVLDPSRVTVYIGLTGIDGATFKREQLMDRFGIQINKTSRNTVLFMTNIGTTRSSVAYLVEVLVNIARDLDQRITEMSPLEAAAQARAVTRQTNPRAPLPNFSGFHPAFLEASDPPTPEGDTRSAFFLSYTDDACEYLPADEIEEKLEAGEPVVSATYVTPYPPGFPVLVPGQQFSAEILAFMRSLDTRRCTATTPIPGTGCIPPRRSSPGSPPSPSIRRPAADGLELLAGCGQGSGPAGGTPPTGSAPEVATPLPRQHLHADRAGCPEAARAADRPPPSGLQQPVRTAARRLGPARSGPPGLGRRALRRPGRAHPGGAGPGAAVRELDPRHAVVLDRHPDRAGGADRDPSHRAGSAAAGRQAWRRPGPTDRRPASDRLIRRSGSRRPATASRGRSPRPSARSARSATRSAG